MRDWHGMGWDGPRQVDRIENNRHTHTHTHTYIHTDRMDDRVGKLMQCP